MSEQPFGGSGIDVRYGKPSSVDIPKSSGSKAVDMWVWIDETSKSLRHGDHTRPSVFVVDGFGHQFVERLICQTSEIGKKGEVSHEEGPQHFWQGEGPQTMRDVFEQLVLEKGGEFRGSLGVAGRADAALFAAPSVIFRYRMLRT